MKKNEKKLEQTHCRSFRTPFEVAFSTSVSPSSILWNFLSAIIGQFSTILGGRGCSFVVPLRELHALPYGAHEKDVISQI